MATESDLAMRPVALQRGINTVGRAEGNHHVIRHESVSSRHCEIVVDDASVTVRDLGSTNGTFIEDQPVQQSALAHGQRLKLGHVEFLLDAPELVPTQGRALRVSVPKATALPASAEGVESRHTAAEAIAALAPTIEPEPEFLRQIPGTFSYPLKRNGLFLLVIGSIVFLVLEFLSGVSRSIFSLGVSVITWGYLFAYMQKIIAHSAQGDDEMPDFPEFSEWWSDIILPFLLFAGTIVVSMLPVILVLVLKPSIEMMEFLFYPALGLSAFYLPMALLAVAVTDNFLALSPHVVVPSILRVFLPYLITFLLLAALFGIRVAGELGVEEIAAENLALRITGTLAMSFVSLYLLTVEMRILGLFFRSYRIRLGWL